MADEQQQGAAPQLTAHDQAMIDKVDAKAVAVQEAATGRPAGDPAEPSKATRPEHVPEKFWDAEKGVVRVEEMAKSYSELEKGKPAPQETQQEAQKGIEEVAASKAVADAGLKEADLAAEFQTTGDFSPATYEALAKAGYSKELVSQYVNGVKAQGQLLTLEAHAAAGGEDNYKAMLAWAGTSLTPGEIQAYDQAVTGTKEQRAQAITALKARFESSKGSEPQLLRGESGAETRADTFASSAEMTAAIRDPRYRKDAAYRAQVERKIGNSSF